MPTKVTKLNRLFRLTEPDGRVAKTAKGNALDGGGHRTRAQAEAQRRAIEAGQRSRALAVRG